MACALGNQETFPDNIVAVLESGTTDNYSLVRKMAFSALEKHVHPNDDLLKNMFKFDSLRALVTDFARAKYSTLPPWHSQMARTLPGLSV